jgi:hypothetical protein
MKRRNFIKNTGLTLAGLAFTNSIYSKNNSENKSLNIIILMSGGVGFEDVIDIKNNRILQFFSETQNINLHCKTNVTYNGQDMEHAASLIQTLQTLKDNGAKNIIISNSDSEGTKTLIHSNLPVSVITTIAQNMIAPYRNDAAIFEEAYKYLNLNENITLILNLEDTDVAHYSIENYFKVLDYYSAQINKFHEFLSSPTYPNKYTTSITVASVLGRNNFISEVCSDGYKGATDHYDESARKIFCLEAKFASTTTIKFEHQKYDSKDLLKQNGNLVI